MRERRVRNAQEVLVKRPQIPKLKTSGGIAKARLTMLSTNAAQVRVKTRGDIVKVRLTMSSTSPLQARAKLSSVHMMTRTTTMVNRLYLILIWCRNQLRRKRKKRQRQKARRKLPPQARRRKLARMKSLVVKSVHEMK